MPLQVTCGAKSAPHTWWRMPGNSWEWSGTQRRSHSQIDVSIGHSERLLAVTRYSERGGLVWY